jgi:hypothetical protein
VFHPNQIRTGEAFSLIVPGRSGACLVAGCLCKVLTLTGADPFGATSSLPSDRAWAQGVGLLVWMIGLWVVTARFAWKAVRPLEVHGGSPVGAARTGAGTTVAA